MDRVPQHTSEDINRQIEMQTAESVRWHAAHPEVIDDRLRELNEEWDIERALEASASVLALAGLLGASVDRRWLAFSGLVSAFLLQHALQGP